MVEPASIAESDRRSAPYDAKKHGYEQPWPRKDWMELQYVRSLLYTKND